MLNCYAFNRETPIRRIQHVCVFLRGQCRAFEKSFMRSNKSIRSIVRNKGVSEFLIRHEGIRYFSYKMRQGQLLSQVTKNKRKIRGTKLCFFLDEQNCCQDQMVNPENNHRLALSTQGVPKLMKTKHSVHMVFVVVTSDANVMPPFVFPQRHTSSTALDRKSGFLEDPTSGCRTLFYAP